MKEELQTKMIQWIETSAQQIGEFASKEIPPFIEEYLRWAFMMNMIDISLFLVIVISMGYVCKLLYGKLKTISIHSDLFPPAVLGFASLCIVFSIITMVELPSFSGKVKECIAIKYAPKVFLVNKAAELVNLKK